MGSPIRMTRDSVADSGEFGTYSVDKLAGDLERRKENRVVCELRCPSFEFGR